MRAIELATGNTYRPVAEILSAEIGDEVSHGTVWRWVQHSGRTLKQEKDRKKLAVMYSGRELESETAKYKRYRLKEKTLCGGIEEPDEFGEKLYLKGEEKLSLSKAKHQLVLGDGDLWIKNIAPGVMLYGHLPTRSATPHGQNSANLEQ